MAKLTFVQKITKILSLESDLKSYTSRFLFVSRLKITFFQLYRIFGFQDTAISMSFWNNVSIS